jgi:hypothetical protein
MDAIDDFEATQAFYSLFYWGIAIQCLQLLALVGVGCTYSRSDPSSLKKCNVGFFLSLMIGG